MSTPDNYCSLDHPEFRARAALSRLVTKEQFLSYIREGFFIENEMHFGANGRIMYQGRRYCIHPHFRPGSDYLPESDKVIHRLLFWRRSKLGFFRVANDQGSVNYGGFHPLYPSALVVENTLFDNQLLQMAGRVSGVPDCTFRTQTCSNFNYYMRPGESVMENQTGGPIVGAALIR